MAQANTVGLVGLLAVFLVLFLIELFLKGGKSYDLLAMLSGFLSVSNFYRYRYIKNKLQLLTGCGWLFCTVVHSLLHYKADDPETRPARPYSAVRGKPGREAHPCS